MKLIYERPDVEYINFSIEDYIMDDYKDFSEGHETGDDEGW